MDIEWTQLKQKIVNPSADGSSLPVTESLEKITAKIEIFLAAGLLSNKLPYLDLAQYTKQMSCGGDDFGTAAFYRGIGLLGSQFSFDSKDQKTLADHIGVGLEVAGTLLNAGSMYLVLDSALLPIWDYQITFLPKVIAQASAPLAILGNLIRLGTAKSNTPASELAVNSLSEVVKQLPSVHLTQAVDMINQANGSEMPIFLSRVLDEVSELAQTRIAKA